MLYRMMFNLLFLYTTKILIQCQALVDREEVSRKEFTEMKERLHSFREDIEGRIMDLIQRIEAKVEEIRRLINKLEVCCEDIQLSNLMDGKVVRRRGKGKGIMKKKWRR